MSTTLTTNERTSLELSIHAFIKASDIEPRFQEKARTLVPTLAEFCAGYETRLTDVKVDFEDDNKGMEVFYRFEESMGFYNKEGVCASVQQLYE
ncbi:MAG: hypothetical protein ACMXYE_02720 [Candidatus Woesearchaeota archaeon]